MTASRLPMRKLREILRWKWELRRSHREVSEGPGVSKGMVSSMVNRAKALGLTLSDVEKMTDDELETRLYDPRQTGKRSRPLPAFAEWEAEIARLGAGRQPK